MRHRGVQPVPLIRSAVEDNQAAPNSLPSCG